MCPARIDRSWLRWPAASGSPLAYGADYNPGQWPRDVWDEDVELMREVGG